MRRGKLSCVAALLILGFVAYFFFRGNGDSGHAETDTREVLVCLNKIGLRDGDLILRHGTGFWSELIREKNLSDKRFSHVGVLTEEAGTFFVIHADCDAAGNGCVKKERLNDFLKNARRIGLFRLKAGNAVSCAGTAKEFVGLPFDRDFNLSNTDELYCTELAFRAVGRIFPDFSPETIELCGKAIIPVAAVVPAELACELFDSGAK